jgi:PAS domain S-box-containing protein
MFQDSIFASGMPLGSSPESRSPLVELLLEHTDDCVKLLDRRGRLVTMNGPGLCAMEIDDFEAFRGKAWATLWPDEAKADVEAAVAAALTGRTARFTAFCPTAKGTPKWWSVTVAPVPDAASRTGALVSVSRDVTELRRAEAELARLRLQAQRSARLDAMGALASTLAHELNQPLAAVANYVAAGRAHLRSLGHDGAATADDLLAAAASQAVRAGEIIRRLRHFVDRGSVAKREIDVGRLVAEAARLALAGEGCTIELDVAIDRDAAEVQADPVQIEQVLTNLIRNAADALSGTAAPRVDIGVRCAGAELHFRVSDNGPGVDPAHADELFTVLLSTKAAGLGVGLSIARTIVEAHGGRIWHEPREGGGASFCFSLPRPKD